MTSDSRVLFLSQCRRCNLGPIKCSEGLRFIPARRVSGRVGVTSPLLRRPPCVISVSELLGTGIWRRVVDVAERRSHPGREALASSPQLSDEPLMVLSVATYGCNTPGGMRAPHHRAPSQASTTYRAGESRNVLFFNGVAGFLRSTRARRVKTKRRSGETTCRCYRARPITPFIAHARQLAL